MSNWESETCLKIGQQSWEWCNKDINKALMHGNGMAVFGQWHSSGLEVGWQLHDSGLADIWQMTGTSGQIAWRRPLNYFTSIIISSQGKNKFLIMGSSFCMAVSAPVCLPVQKLQDHGFKSCFFLFFSCQTSITKRNVLKWGPSCSRHAGALTVI